MKAQVHKKSTKARSEALRSRRRTQILKCAAKLFAQYGYAGADTQLLCDQLSVGKGTIYRYFKNKEDLFLSVVDDAMRQMRQWIDAGIEGIDGPLERITHAIQCYLTFVADHPEFVELLIQERAQFRDRKKPTYFIHREANRERWKALYESLIEEERIRHMPVERILNVISQLLYGTIFINYFTGQHKSPAEQAREIHDVVFHGILSDKERAVCPSKQRG
jgi:AcrR family transcriptional regulator